MERQVRPLRQREKVAFIKIRRFAYSQSIIAKAFRRSTSVVNRYIQKAILRGILSWHDLRKIPNQNRRISKALQWRRIMSWLPKWERWILGEEDRPP